MTDLCRYAQAPFAFFVRYIRRRPRAHGAILAIVLGAIICAVGTQYGLKHLVDTLSRGSHGNEVWWAFGIVVSLIAADNMLWRAAGLIASYTFVAVTGDVRRDLFRHLIGHSPGYFTERMPGTLTGRITATSNAAFTVENMFIWNVLPPCVGTAGSIALLATVSGTMAAGLVVIAGILVFILFRWAGAGRPLHLDFADKAAAVDGEMVDIVGNMPLVRAFGGAGREQFRFGCKVDEEMTARRRSLVHLEKLRLFHAAVTVLLTIGLLAWAIMLWQNNRATTGDVVLVSTLGLGVLYATRDLAVALVDVTQHLARLSEALSILLAPHEMCDHPEAVPLVRKGASVAFENVSFRYPDARHVFDNFSLRLEPGQRVGLIGPSGSGKSTLFALLQRFYDVQTGRIVIDGQDIARVTQESLREAIAVVPQDISLFHRSVLENIRYGRPDASDEDVLAAAVAARCMSFIDVLPAGISTIVGDRGVKLSGGQRQRIAIARALLKNAPIVLLDEATSALDSESEEAIRQALSRLMRGRTVIAIAHRLSTLRSFDRIVVLQAGRVLEDGSPEKLITRNGAYRQLIEQEVTRLARVA